MSDAKTPRNTLADAISASRSASATSMAGASTCTCTPPSWPTTVGNDSATHGPGPQPPCATLRQYIAGMIRATPPHDLHDPRERRGCRAACRLALLLGLGLQAAVLTACNKPEPGAPASGHAPAPAGSAAAAATPSPAALPETAAGSAPPAAAAETAAPAADAAASKPAAALPPAVVRFQKQRDACDHFRGEEPYDKQRAAFLKAQLAKACKGSDKALAALRKRFAHDPEAISALKGYEDRIE